MQQQGPDLEIFHLFFGVLRQAIWKADPRMRVQMLNEGTSHDQIHPSDQEGPKDLDLPR